MGTSTGGWSRLVLAAAAAAAIGGFALLLAPAVQDAAGAVPDDQCTAAFPHGVFPVPSTDPVVSGLRVCTNSTGTRVLIRNQTSEVWRLGGPEGAPLSRLPMSSLNTSFLDLVGEAGPVIPSGAVVAALRPVADLSLRIDPRLTVAQLAHDQLVSVLGGDNDLMWAALTPERSVARRALSVCLAALMDRLEPTGALASGFPADAISTAAAAAAQGPWSDCGATWLEAKLDFGMPPDEATSFADDVHGWQRSLLFAARSQAAAHAYRVVTLGPGSRE